ncbi:hypothetical protein AADZ90_006745 [Aestuariibius sp. 2305UL40-4]|uniref:hypothetical protein n=1 Tax=Aestuariibius violaceus TaxID=3234132 RepID=UPI0034994EBF
MPHADLQPGPGRIVSGPMETTRPDPILDQLLGLETTKTWSLIATIFGDLDGDRLSGKELGTLLAPLGVKPEAMRVALHRLKKDGWIISEKNGREVVYALSDHGRQETFAAQKDVYRRDVKFAEGWRLIMLPGEAARPYNGPHIAIDRGLLLVPKGAGALPADALELSLVEPIPDWFESRLAPPHVWAQAGRLTDLAEQFLAGPRLGQISARLMFLHYWRKMALRTGTWAHIGLVPEGTMANCHAAVTEVFEQTSRTKIT